MEFKYNYAEEILLPEWQRKKAEIMQRDNFTCQVCSAKYKQLHVHHTYYDYKLHYWEYPDNMLLTLCCDCHNKETQLNRILKQSIHLLDANIVDIFISSMKKGVPMIQLKSGLEKISLMIPQDELSSIPMLNLEKSSSSSNVHSMLIKEIPVDANTDTSKWVCIPFIFSRLTGNFTLIQQRIIIGIIYKLQHRILDSISDRVSLNSFSEIFEVSELSRNETIPITLSTYELGVRFNCYNQLEEAAQLLINSKIKYPVFYKRENLIKEYKTVALFSSITLPKSKMRRNGEVQILLNTKEIKDVLSMQMGYVRYLREITFIAKKKRTPRMYMLLSRYRNIGHKRIVYSDLLEYLGMTNEYRSQEQIEKNKYNVWNNVRVMVLEPIRKEMDKLANEDKIDFSFSYEPVYPGTKKRGNPKEIAFVILNKNGEK